MVERTILVVALLALCACAHRDTAPTSATNILVFGDSGYDYDWLGEDDHDDAFTGREFIIDELDDWIDDKHPVEDFRLPPMHYAEQTGGYVMASGQQPVSRAVRDWCAPAGRCNFGVMLGDNIYPAGATMGADGRDDQQRFEALLSKPYESLQTRDSSFVIYPVLGNHDWATSREGAELQIEYMKSAPLFNMGGEFYRARPAPGVEIFAIDTTVLLAGETVYADALNADGSAAETGRVEAPDPWAVPRGKEKHMVDWLARALAESDAHWKIVIGHHPLWSSSGTKQEESKVLRDLLLPTLCRYADAYLSGHEHTLEVHTDDCRSAGDEYMARPPLLQVVSGAAGKQRPVHRPFMRWQDRTYPQKKTWYARGFVWGFTGLALAGDVATVQVVSTSNSGDGSTTVEFEHDFARRSGGYPGSR